MEVIQSIIKEKRGLPTCKIHSKMELSWACMEKDCKNRLLCQVCVIHGHIEKCKNFMNIYSYLEDPLSALQKLDIKTKEQQDEENNEPKEQKNILEQTQILVEQKEYELSQLFDSILKEVDEAFNNTKKNFMNDLEEYMKQDVEDFKVVEEKRQEYTQLVQKQFMNQDMTQKDQVEVGIESILKTYFEDKPLQEKLDKTLSCFPNVLLSKDYEMKIKDTQLDELKYKQFLDKDPMIALKYGSMQIFEYSWDLTKMKGFDSDLNDPLKLKCKGGCSQDKYCMSKEQIPQEGLTWIEVTKTHINGCYDSVGVCQQYKQRNGTNEKGWCVRVYGQHNDKSFSGAWHNNKGEDFFGDWKANSVIGMLYNSDAGTLTYFQDGKPVGTPFKNVKGELYFIIEGCHQGSFSKTKEPKLPDEKYLKDLE